ncbi:intracellular protein transport protein USO1-like [Fagus crenata]
MDLPQEIDDYIKDSIDHSLGLPVSTQTLELKLSVSQEAQRRLRSRCLSLQHKLQEKEDLIDRIRAESIMNAQALKKFVEENQKLALECANLLSQCNKWERECSLYDHDREALMDFGNEADERAKEAEIRVHELEEEVRRLSEELQFYKCECEMRAVESSAEDTIIENGLLESVLTTLISKDDLASAHAFLEANSSHESCQRLLKMWNQLRPSTQKVLSLAAEVKTLEKDKDHLRINLNRAEEEVKLLFEENNILDEENKRLLRQYQKERSHHGSGGKHTGTASAKSNKRKSSPKMSSPLEKKLDFNDLDLARLPLSPLRNNSSPDSKLHKF